MSPGRAALAAEIARWQKALWRFTSVGQIGKVGGPKAWMEPVTPIVARQELRLKMPGSAAAARSRFTSWRATPATATSTTSWSGSKPRLVAPGRPDLLLRDVRGRRPRAGERARASLQLRGQVSGRRGRGERGQGPGRRWPTLARRHGVEPAILAAWLDYLGIGTSGAAVKIDTPLDGQDHERVGLRLRERLGLAASCRTSSPTRRTSTCGFPAT